MNTIEDWKQIYGALTREVSDLAALLERDHAKVLAANLTIHELRAENARLRKERDSFERAFRARGVTQAEIDSQGVRSVGTCALCGYHGPGPKHPCTGAQDWVQRHDEEYAKLRAETLPKTK